MRAGRRCRRLCQRLTTTRQLKAHSSSVILEDKNYGTFFDFLDDRQRSRLSGDAPYFFWLYIKVKDTEKRLQRGDSDMKEMLKLITDIRIDVTVLI